MSAPYQPGAVDRFDHIPSTSDDRTLAALLHLSAFVLSFVGPLVIWLVQRERSPFIDHHGKQAVNFHLSMLLYSFVTFIAIFFLIGLLLLPFLIVLGFVLPIVAAVKAAQGKSFRYPLAIPFLS
jgi:uncharacterized Tic20 family protein